MKAGLLLVAVAAFHVLHSALGIPVEGVEQIILAIAQEKF